VLAAGCGNGEIKLEPAPPDVDRAVRRLFATYTNAIATRDFRTACQQLEPDSIDRMRRGAERLVPVPPRECPALLGLLTRNATPKDQAGLVEVSRTARVRRVFVSEKGPIISWTALVKGKRVPVAQAVKRVRGEYKLVAVSR
jgi:hypothetical protein